MIVWLVDRSYDYEGSDTEGVFSTEDKALRYVAEKAREGTGSAKYAIFAVEVDRLVAPLAGTAQEAK